MKKTTQKQYKAFQKAFLETTKKMGLKQYKFYFGLSKLEDCYASITTSQSGKQAVIQLADEHDGLLEPEIAGVHEAIHLMLARYTALAHDRHSTAKELDEEEEGLVRILEKLL